MDVNNIHDKEIIGLSHNISHRILTLYCLYNEKIVFEKIVHFELDCFSTQNIIFDIYQYTFNKLPEILLSDYPSLKNFMFSDYKFYHINASTGMSGVIICDNR